MTSTNCVACGRTIDSAAKVCPYCGADRATGEKLDTQSLMQEIFRPRQVTTGETVIEYARQRQGIVIVVSAIVLFVILALLHQFVTARNDSAVSAAAAVPLTEVTDLSNRPDESPTLEMPKIDFQYGGQPKAMRTFIVEPGAVTPPEVVAEQQAAQQAALEKQAAQQPAVPQPAVPQPPPPAPTTTQ